MTNFVWFKVLISFVFAEEGNFLTFMKLQGKAEISIKQSEVFNDTKQVNTKF